MKYLITLFVCLLVLSACDDSSFSAAKPPQANPKPIVATNPSPAITSPGPKSLPLPPAPSSAGPVLKSVEAYKTLETTVVIIEAPKAVEITVAKVAFPKPIQMTAISLSSAVPVASAPISIEAVKPAPVEISEPLEPVPEPVPVVEKRFVFDAKNQLGKGAFGNIYRGEYNGDIVAIKKFSRDPSVEQEAWRLFQEESRIMKDLQCPNIVQLCGVEEHDKQQCLILEYAPFGALNVLLAKAKRDGEKFVEMNQLQWCEDIANATNYLHARGIIHRDIKSANILVFPEPDAQRKYSMKLADFGLALDTKTNRETASAFCGTIPWMAPERANPRHVVCNEKSDVYSVGMVFWEMTSKSTPYFGNTAVTAIPRIIDGPEEKRQPFPKDASPKLVELIILCWKKDLDARPNAAEVAEALANRIQEITDEEAVALLQPQKFPPPVEEAARQEQEVPRIEPAQVPAATVVQKISKPVSPPPQLRRIDSAFEWLERKVDTSARWMNDNKLRSSQFRADAPNVFEVVQSNWWGRQQKRLLHITETQIERINPIGKSLRVSVAIVDLDRLEVSQNNDTLKVVYVDHATGKGVADTYVTSNANAIAESIKRVRPGLRVTTLE